MQILQKLTFVMLNLVGCSTHPCSQTDTQLHNHQCSPPPPIPLLNVVSRSGPSMLGGGLEVYEKPSCRLQKSMFGDHAFCYVIQHWPVFNRSHKGSSKLIKNPEQQQQNRQSQATCCSSKAISQLSFVERHATHSTETQGHRQGTI